MADTKALIVQKSQANTPSILSFGTTGTTLVTNAARSAWSIQNVGTTTVYVTLANAGSATVYHFALKGGTANDDGTGGSASQTDGVVYTGPITVTTIANNTCRFVVMEIS